VLHHCDRDRDDEHGIAEAPHAALRVADVHRLALRGEFLAMQPADFQAAP
jgi:hypothetical protein